MRTGISVLPRRHEQPLQHSREPSDHHHIRTVQGGPANAGPLRRRGGQGVPRRLAHHQALGDRRRSWRRSRSASQRVPSDGARTGSVEVKKRALPGEARAWLVWALFQETDECLLWPFAAGTRKPNGRGGYGRINKGDGVMVDVHRHACELAHGPAPSPKHEAAHKCGTRLCCNKRHLSWKTPAQNKADELVHGTRNRGERHGLSKLTAHDVRMIRADDRPPRIVAAAYGVSEATIRDAVAGRTWGWLDAA